MSEEKHKTPFIGFMSLVVFCATVVTCVWIIAGGC